MARIRFALQPSRWFAAATGLVIVCLSVAMLSGPSRSSAAPVAHAAAASCTAPDPATRNPSNPLDLASAPGSDPLNGARFMVPGPGSGRAAGAIAQLLGIDPKSLPPTESWAEFSQDLQSGPLHAQLAADPALAKKVDELALIAGQPQAQRITSGSSGGAPSGIYKQTRKVLCSVDASDPGTIPIITTYFLHAALHACPSTRQIKAYMPRFKAQIDAMAEATGNHPIVYLLELDAIGSSGCIAKRGSLPAWEAALRYEMRTIQALPHTVVYVEGGYSDANKVAYAARILNAIGVKRIRGFFVNDTHNEWTMNEVRWAKKIAAKTHGAHFIVNTSDNGRGPKLNLHPSRQGIEDLCNPPGRGIGIEDTTDTGFADADAFLWTHTPGMSAGRCNGGPASGFWPAKAEREAARANDRLGPGRPSSPYAAPDL